MAQFVTNWLCTSYAFW